MVERAGLENRCTGSRYRGFESLLLRFRYAALTTKRPGALEEPGRFVLVAMTAWRKGFRSEYMDED